MSIIDIYLNMIDIFYLLSLNIFISKKPHKNHNFNIKLQHDLININSYLIKNFNHFIHFKLVNSIQDDLNNMLFFFDFEMISNNQILQMLYFFLNKFIILHLKGNFDTNLLYQTNNNFKDINNNNFKKYHNILQFNKFLFLLLN